MNRRPRQSGFTLLELIFVLVIVSTTLALAAPSLRGWSRGSKLRDTAEEFLALVRYGRAQAIGNGIVYRIQVDAGGGKYQLMAQQREQFVDLGTEWGRIFSVPEGFRIVMNDEQSAPMQTVDFFASGRTQTARVRITSPEGDAIELQCPSPAEGFRILSSEEMSRP